MKYYIRTSYGKYEVINAQTDAVIAVFKSSELLNKYLEMKEFEQLQISNGVDSSFDKAHKDFSTLFKSKPLDVTPKKEKDANPIDASDSLDNASEVKEPIVEEKLEKETSTKFKTLIIDEEVEKKNQEATIQTNSPDLDYITKFENKIKKIVNKVDEEHDNLIHENTRKLREEFEKNSNETYMADKSLDLQVYDVYEKDLSNDLKVTLGDDVIIEEVDKTGDFVEENNYN